MTHITDKKIRELYLYRVSGTHGPARISVSIHEQHVGQTSAGGVSPLPRTFIAMPANPQIYICSQQPLKELEK